MNNKISEVEPSARLDEASSLSAHESQVLLDNLNSKYIIFVSIQQQNSKFPSKLKNRLDCCTTELLNKYKELPENPPPREPSNTNTNRRSTRTKKSKERSTSEREELLTNLVCAHTQFTHNYLMQSSKKGHDKEKNLKTTQLQQLDHQYCNFLVSIRREAQEFLHNLDDRQHSSDMVSFMIKTFPTALTTQFHGYFPIQSCSLKLESISLVPVLAIEGAHLGIPNGGLDLEVPQELARISKLPVCNHKARDVLTLSLPSSHGGTLVEDLYTVVPPPTHRCSVREWMVTSISMIENDEVNYDNKSLEALKKLIEEADPNFHHYFQKIIAQSASWESIYHKGCKQRAAHLFDAYATELSNGVGSGADLPIHISISTLDGFSTIFEAGMKHHPDSLGYIFEPNENGDIALNVAVDHFGKDVIMRLIQQHVPETSACALTEKILEHIPSLFHEISQFYNVSVTIEMPNSITGASNTSKSFSSRPRSSSLRSLHSSSNEALDGVITKKYESLKRKRKQAEKHREQLQARKVSPHVSNKRKQKTDAPRSALSHSKFDPQMLNRRAY